MKRQTRLARTLIGSIVVVTLSLPLLGMQQHKEMGEPMMQDHSNGSVVIYPWTFTKGTDTARETAMTTLEEVALNARFSSKPADMAKQAWDTQIGGKTLSKTPSMKSIRAFGKAMHATKVIYGSVSWHTRSIWVNVGPKTISTATVNAYVMDVASGKLSMSKRGVTGRSDEKTNGWKVAAAVLMTPLVTAVSGGPATPHEQRAAQIAIGKAFAGWVTNAQAFADRHHK